jgi:hypothetical protein
MLVRRSRYSAEASGVTQSCYAMNVPRMVNDVKSIAAVNIPVGGWRAKETLFELYVPLKCLEKVLVTESRELVSWF